MNTPLINIEPIEATQRLNQIVNEAYKRRSRQLPNNIGDIVSTLKADLLKYMPSVGIETIDEAVSYEVLHDDKTPLSPTFLFAAVRKHYAKPTEVRDEDKDELWQWRDRLRELENRGLANSPKADECRWWIDKITKGDDEGETIALLDICAQWVKRTDDEQRVFTVTAKNGVVVELPAFNPRREYDYLVMRHQLADDSLSHFFDQALSDTNTERLASRHHRLSREEAAKDPDVVARQKRLAVIDWLRSCNTNNTTPSAILTPLAEELSYFELRRNL